MPLAVEGSSSLLLFLKRRSLSYVYHPLPIQQMARVLVYMSNFRGGMKMRMGQITRRERASGRAGLNGWGFEGEGWVGEDCWVVGAGEVDDIFMMRRI